MRATAAGRATLLAAALLAAALGCARRRALAPPGPVGSALVALAADLGSAPSDVADAWRELDAIAERVDRHHQRTGGDWVDDLNAVVFGDLGYAREIESGDVRFFRLPSVIAARRGSCVGLSALYLALGERLGVGLDGVSGRKYSAAPAGHGPYLPRYHSSGITSPRRRSSMLRGLPARVRTKK